MTMLGLTRAVRASAIAFAIFPIAGCGGQGRAETDGAHQPAATAARTVVDDGRVSGRSGSDGSASALDVESEAMMDSTWIEQHHFNVYQRFRAMLDADSRDPGAATHDGTSGPEDDDDFPCPGSGLIKPDE